MGCCCCCFPTLPESSRTIDEHVPLSRAPTSSVVPTEAVNRNLASNLYTAPLQPPLPVSFSPRNPSKLPITQSNSSQVAREVATHSVPEKVPTQSVPGKETWPADDVDLKKKNRETIDECPICLEEYDIENPKLLTKCGHNFHLACILEWMERSEACPVCDKELVITES